VDGRRRGRESLAAVLSVAAAKSAFIIMVSLSSFGSMFA